MATSVMESLSRVLLCRINFKTPTTDTPSLNVDNSALENVEWSIKFVIAIIRYFYNFKIGKISAVYKETTSSTHFVNALAN